MAIQTYSEAELLNLCRMPDERFTKELLTTFTLRSALIFRRNLQKSLADYSKKHKATGGFDPIQAGIIKRCYMIEKMCRKAFLSGLYPYAMEKTKKTGIPLSKIKAEAMNKWEKLIARSNY